MQNQEIKPPFVPNVKNVFEYLSVLSEGETEEDVAECELALRRDSVQGKLMRYVQRL